MIVKSPSETHVRRLSAVILALLIGLPVQAQQPPPSAPPAPSTTAPAAVHAQAISPQLKIYILQGKNAIHSPVSGNTIIPVVEVRDENELPVEGAEVIFEAPADGPTVRFTGDRPIYTAITDANGQAVARDFEVVPVPGRFSIQVTARMGEREGRTTIEQMYSPQVLAESEFSERKSSKKKWIIIGAIAAGAIGGGIYAATRGGGGSSGQIGIVPGPITIGGLR